jgi:peptidoglycan/xylan/chitin deacetylase (PgdA/CDA1 family)
LKDVRFRAKSSRSNSTVFDYEKILHMPLNHPGEVEHYAFFSSHLGPTFRSAGLRVQFHYNHSPGIHFVVEPPAEYAEAIRKGLRDGLKRCFPNFPESGSVWVKEFTVHDTHSSQEAFYRVGLLVMRQALALVEIAESKASVIDSE